MLKKLLFTILIVFSLSALMGQGNYNIDFISNVTYPENASDIWGYVDHEGREYAIMGLHTSTVILSLEDPAHPVEIAEIPGARSIWRDIKSYGNFLYVTADQGEDGLLIIDMSEAPLKITWEFWNEEIFVTGNPRPLNRCHNLYIDENGIMYLSGCTPHANGAVLMFDLNENPRNPVFLGPTDFEYSHDVYARGDTVYSSQINAGQLAIIDVADKSNPVILGTAETSLNFTHNLWLSDDGRYLFSTDEKPNGKIDAYDISELPDIRRIDSFEPLDIRGHGAIPHNVHYYNGYLVISWYTSGCVIVDAHNPANLIQVGAYDTFDGPDGGFNGAWGAYPFLPSGKILISDIQSGLYVLDPQYVRASYLEGKITDASTGIGINNVSVSIDTDILNNVFSDFTGDYKTGLRIDGSFDVTFSHPNYLPQTITVDLVRGEITALNVELEPEGIPTLAELRFVDVDNMPVPGVQIFYTNSKYVFNDTTDINGQVTTNIFEGDFSIYAAKWGFENIFLENINFPAGIDTAIVMRNAYEDDFELDLGWSHKSTASVGLFERGIPEPTFLNGEMSNPASSSPLSTGPYCYVTGASAGNEVGDFDLDNGSTEIKSPSMFLDNYQNPHIEFDYWFYNAGGAGSPNDIFRVVLYNGEDYRELFSTQESQSAWRTFEAAPVGNYIEYTGKPLEIIFFAADTEPGHIVEAAVDRFKITDREPVSHTEILQPSGYRIFPNPTGGRFTLEVPEGRIAEEIHVVSLNGTVIRREKIFAPEQRMEFNMQGISPGLYLVYVTGRGKEKILINKLVITY